MGYAIQTINQGHYHAFYAEYHTFSPEETQILMDAVEAASFIPAKISRDLKKRIVAIDGKEPAVSLSGSAINFNEVKRSNSTVFETVKTLQGAIREHHQVSFRYFDLDENHKRVYRKDGERYQTSPICTVYNSDRYYLLAWSEKHQGITRYRIDRMASVKEEMEEACPESICKPKEIREMLKQTFRMYGGTKERCRLYFEDSMMEQIYDKFGEKVGIQRVDENHCSCEVELEVSPTFLGWIFQYGGKIQIDGPERVRDEFDGWWKK